LVRQLKKTDPTARVSSLADFMLYGIYPKAVRTCVCEKNDTAHVRSLTMRDPIYTTEREVIYAHTYVHADIPNTNTRACLARHCTTQ
jgi:hypothetical protein